MRERMDPMSEFFIYPVGSAGSDYARSAASNQETHRQQAEVHETKSPIPMHSFPGNTRLVSRWTRRKTRSLL